MGRLQGKHAVISGAGTGIGRAAALLFVQEGAGLVLVGRRQELLEETARQIREAGGTCLPVPADLADPAGAETAIRRAEREFGAIEILFNNHGTFEPGSVPETPPESWDRVLSNNLRSVYLTCRAAIPGMRRKGGSIINTASTLGVVAMRDAAAYCAAKGGLVQLTRAMALDHAPDRIRVNVICPGVVDTPMWRQRRDREGRPLERKDFEELHPIGRMGAPEDIAALALYLASDESAWMTGSVLTLDGGLTAS